MTVVKLWIPEKVWDDVPAQAIVLEDKVKQLLCEGIAVNTTAYVEKKASRTWFYLSFDLFCL